MSDSAKIASTFRAWSGIDVSLISGEFKAALSNADTSRDGKLSRNELASIATKFGLTAAQTDAFFANARGTSAEIVIADLLTRADAANATDGVWTQTEFTAFLTTLTTPPPPVNQSTIFEGLAGADLVLQRSELLALVTSADANSDGKITKEEFQKIAKDMGVNKSQLAVTDEKFFDLAGADNSAKTNDILAYFAAYANTGGTYNFAAFNNIVNSLGGTLQAVPPPPSRPPPENQVVVPSTNAVFTGIAGSDDLIQQSETNALLGSIDANTNAKLTKSEFGAFVAALGVTAEATPTANANAIFDIIANGGTEITVDEAKAYLSAFNGADSNWDEGEFNTIAARLSAGPVATFASLVTANTVITTAALTNIFNAADKNTDARLSMNEFGFLAARLGLNGSTPARFAALAGSDASITLAEITAFANPLGTTANGSTTWTEAQFNTVLSALNGA